MNWSRVAAVVMVMCVLCVVAAVVLPTVQVDVVEALSPLGQALNQIPQVTPMP